MANRRQASTRSTRTRTRDDAAGSDAMRRGGTSPSSSRVTIDAGRSAIRWWQPLVLLLLVAAVYANSLGGPLVFDDQLTIVENRSLRSLTAWRALLLPERELPVAGRPAANLSFALNYALHGADVAGYHVVNIGLHAACVLLAFGLIRRSLRPAIVGERLGTGAASVAFGAAALWAIHPLNSEAVNYVTQRTELLMAACYLTTLYAAIRAADARNTGGWTLLAVLACAMGMGCKESMVTAPVIVALYDRVFFFDSFRAAWDRRWRLYAGLGASWIVLALLMASGPRIHSAGFGTGISPWVYLLNQTTMILRYLELTVWPRGLVLNYGAPVPRSIGEVWPAALAVTGLGVATLAGLWLRSPVGFLGAWFFVTLAPTSSLVPIATEVGAERRMYLPLLALAAGIVAVLWVALVRGEADDAPVDREDRLMARNTPAQVNGAVALVLLVGALALLGWLTVSRNREYRSALSLAQTTFERWPTPETRHMYASELSLAGREEEALAELKQAAPGFPRANYNLGIALFRQKAFAEALTALDAFIKAYPALLEVVEARVIMGRALMELGKPADAITAFQDALRMRPSRTDVHGMLADALVKLQRGDEAIEHYRAFLAGYPDDAGALNGLGVLLVERERYREAVPIFQRAVDLEPANPLARRNLASALLGAEDVPNAVRQARQAAALAPGDPLAFDLLGMALIAQGLPAEAVLSFRRANDLAPSDATILEHLNAAQAMHAARATGLPDRR